MITIDFTAIASTEILEQLEKECQYQLCLTDGCHVIWHATTFSDRELMPANNAESQAILQYFGRYACPFSLHRLGCSFSPRNTEHGPISSDGLAIHCLLKGFEVLSNWKHDFMVKDALGLYMSTQEYLQASQLIMTYWDEIETRNICPKVMDTILSINELSTKVQ